MRNLLRYMMWAQSLPMMLGSALEPQKPIFEQRCNMHAIHVEGHLVFGLPCLAVGAGFLPC